MCNRQGETRGRHISQTNVSNLQNIGQALTSKIAGTASNQLSLSLVRHPSQRRPAMSREEQYLHLLGQCTKRSEKRPVILMLDLKVAHSRSDEGVREKLSGNKTHLAQINRHQTVIRLFRTGQLHLGSQILLSSQVTDTSLHLKMKIASDASKVSTQRLSIITV